MGKVKRLELWWQLYRTSLAVWELENFRPMDFCWHECTFLLFALMSFCFSGFVAFIKLWGWPLASSCPSVCTEQLGLSLYGFSWNLTFEYFFENLSRKLKFHQNLTRKTALHMKTIFDCTLSVLLRMRNVSDKSCRDKIHVLCSVALIFIESLSLYLIMWKKHSLQIKISSEVKYWRRNPSYGCTKH